MPGVKGFSPTNLKYISYFYKLYAPLQANCPQLADNFIEDLYIADIQRVVAQSKKRVCHKSVTHPFLFLQKTSLSMAKYEKHSR